MTNDIKYFYLHDPTTANLNKHSTVRYSSPRVLTIARRLNTKGTKVHYQFSMSMPPRRTEPRFDYMEHEGDMFSKSRGRTIAEGRLLNKPFKASMTEFEAPLTSVLKHAASNEQLPHTARRLIKTYLKNQSKRKLSVEVTTFTKGGKVRNMVEVEMLSAEDIASNAKNGTKSTPATSKGSVPEIVDVKLSDIQDTFREAEYQGDRVIPSDRVAY